MSLIPLLLAAGQRGGRAQVRRAIRVLAHGGRRAAPQERQIQCTSIAGLMMLFIGLLLASGVRAFDAVDVVLVAEVRQDVELAGRNVARLVPATELRQGEEVFYTVRILNPSAAAAREVVVVQPIPQNTTYVPNSAGGPGAEITFSADGGQTFAREGQVTIAEPAVVPAVTSGVASGDPARGASVRTVMTRLATPQEYTHIRWRLRNALAPGAVALARFRAVFH